MSIITTSRLIIRSFCQKDAPALFDYLSSPSTPCFFDEKLISLKEAEENIKKRSTDNTQFAVSLKENDILIGHLFADNANEPDQNTYCIGWHFNQKYEGRGFAIESVNALFNTLFNKKMARRIYAYVEDDNISSQKLCTRLGMRQEGCFREFVSFLMESGVEKYANTLVYSLLKKEWDLAQH